MQNESHGRKPLVQRKFSIHPVGTSSFLCPECKKKELRGAGPGRMTCTSCGKDFTKKLVPTENEAICQPFIFIQAVL